MGGQGPVHRERAQVLQRPQQEKATQPGAQRRGWGRRPCGPDPAPDPAPAAQQATTAGTGEDVEELQDIIDQTDEAPVIRWVNDLFYGAVKDRASDIHIEPTDDKVIVRFRIVFGAPAPGQNRDREHFHPVR